jgi:AcrR family transcriptional regulator
MPTASRTRRKAGPSVKALDAYHHGNLRAALVAAAREALETSPPDAVTLKSLASRLGVSQPAPYRHFASREALLVAVATDGFVRFREALIAAAKDAPRDEALERGALAYLAFGRANRGLYRLMFASNLLTTAKEDARTDPDAAALGQAAAAAFDVLLDSISTHVGRDEAPATALWVWASLHGLVMLEAEDLASGPLPRRLGTAQIVRHMIRTLSRP